MVGMSIDPARREALERRRGGDAAQPGAGGGVHGRQRRRGRGEGGQGGIAAAVVSFLLSAIQVIHVLVWRWEASSVGQRRWRWKFYTCLALFSC